MLSSAAEVAILIVKRPFVVPRDQLILVRQNVINRARSRNSDVLPYLRENYVERHLTEKTCPLAERVVICPGTKLLTLLSVKHCAPLAVNCEFHPYQPKSTKLYFDFH